MSVWAIIPVKPLNRAKSRLSTVLSPQQRHHLAEMMFRHVLEVLQNTPQVMGTLVISRDTKALSIAREYDARTVQESGAPELNAAMMRATQVITSWGCNAMLALPADLPLVTSDDIATIIEMGHELMSVVVAPDQHDNGTNVLFMRPPGIIPYSFGDDSFHRHVAAARQLNLSVYVYRSARTALDIDLPEHLDQYNQYASLDYLLFEQNT